MEEKTGNILTHPHKTGLKFKILKYPSIHFYLHP